MRLPVLFVLFPALVLVPACSRRSQILRNRNQGPIVTSEVSDFRVLPPEPPPPRPASLSPYSIKSYILQDRSDGRELFTDLTPVWQELHIDNGEHEAFKGLTPGYNKWQAGIINVPPTNRRHLVILRISTDWEDDRRYLVFEEDNATKDRNWRFLGNIDFIFDRHLESIHKAYYRVVSDGKNVWLVLRYESNGGTGGFSISEAWYRIAEKVTRVLDYPIYGYFANDYVTNRKYESRIVSEHRALDGYTVNLLFSAKYTGFRKTQRATYEWNSRSGSFVLDAGRSQISEEEIEEAYSAGVIRDEKFLSYYYPELRWLAENGSRKQRDWLAAAMKRISDCAQKSELERRLKAGNANNRYKGV